MADLVSVLVDVDAGGGHDYTSLNAAEADNWGATSADLISEDENVECECIASSGSADTTAVDIDGLTTDATRFLKIFTDTDRHSGVWSDSLYRLDIATGSTDAIRVSDPFVTLDGLQVSVSVNGTYGIHVSLTNDEVSTVINCIIRTTPVSNTREGLRNVYGTGSGATCYWHNNIIYGPWDYGFITSTTTYYFDNNTLHGCIDGIREAGGTVVCRNNVVQDSSGSNFVGSPDSPSDYNVSDDATSAGGAHDWTTTSVTFENEGGDDFHLDSTEDGNYEGVDLSGIFTTDIDGDTRSDWDCGVDEIVGATVHSGQCSMSASGTVSVAATAVRPGASSMTGSGSVTAAASAIRPAASAMTGSGALTSAATAIRSASCSMTGSGSVTCAATAIRPGASSMTGSGSVTAAASAIRPGASAMTGR